MPSAKKLAACATAVVFSFSLSASATDTRIRPDSAGVNRHLYRNLIAANLTGGTAAYIYLRNTWGAPDGNFHLKHEFDDNMNLTDEASHLYISYKLTEGFAWLFKTFRMREERVRLFGALQAVLVATLVEFPLDAYNPDQGMGLTDLVANYAGIGFALWKMKYPNNFDLKFSVKRSPLAFKNKVFANANEEFDNYIWWAAWKPRYLWTGIGYSTNHDHANVESEYYLGVGTTLRDLISLVNRKFAGKIDALDAYYLNLKLAL